MDNETLDTDTTSVAIIAYETPSLKDQVITTTVIGVLGVVIPLATFAAIGGVVTGYQKIAGIVSNRRDKKQAKAEQIFDSATVLTDE